ncbi:hypothetical protein GCM10017771_68090 [Streptomyces capitiformicae]|uniref:Uncharacterized protein n=1 Tax=Streptomyces capitiformicae TaxID=2014920 RepID=A0A919DH66_9ACTN|nr:hypothetical protein GCM10017771_68090 [Streptomyces capitiformicae]
MNALLFSSMPAMRLGYPLPRSAIQRRSSASPERAIDVSTQDVPEAAVRVVDPEDTATLITFFPVQAPTGSENGLA